MENALNNQVGGNHYKKLAYQPAQFRHDIHLLANPGAIVKYISRDKDNIIEDLRKAAHFCQICKELDDTNVWTYIHRLFPRPLKKKIKRFIYDNHLILKDHRSKILFAVATGRWDEAEKWCNKLIGYYKM